MSIPCSVAVTRPTTFLVLGGPRHRPLSAGICRSRRLAFGKIYPPAIVGGGLATVKPAWHWECTSTRRSVGEREPMDAPNIPFYSRSPFETSLVAQIPRPTRSQAVLEYALFAVVISMVIVALLAVIFTNSPEHRQVPNRIAAGMAADRVNLLLVVADSDRSRAFTESLTLLAVRPSTGDVTVISIPSDLWVRLGHYGGRRIGSAIAIGSTSGYPGRGPGLVSDAVSTVLDQPVHGFVRLTPERVTQLVDQLGGIDLEIKNGVYDTYTRDRFHRGRQHLSGRQATRYAFSRRMAGTANDRFAREARQRELLAELLTRKTTASHLRANARGVTTNLDDQQLASLYSRVAGRTARTVTLAPYVDVVEVKSITYRGEAVRARLGDFGQLRQIAANAFLTPVVQVP